MDIYDAERLPDRTRLLRKSGPLDRMAPSHHRGAIPYLLERRLGGSRRTGAAARRPAPLRKPKRLRRRPVPTRRREL